MPATKSRPLTARELEFLGSEYDNGYAFGMRGAPLKDALRVIKLELGRGLTDHEREQFDNGHRAGAGDLEQYKRDQASRPDPVLCDLPW